MPNVSKTKDSKPKVQKKSVQTGVSVSVVDHTGKETGTVALPKELFAATVHPQLLAQALRVYQANLREHSAHTKTRGDVQGSTRKIYRQKGSGKARHGAIRAPIFVHGGVAHGPKARMVRLVLPKKMKRLALAGALTEHAKAKSVFVVDGIQNTMKTQDYATLLRSVVEMKKVLFVYAHTQHEFASRNTKNIDNVLGIEAKNLNALEVMKHRAIVLVKDSIAELEKTFVK